MHMRRCARMCMHNIILCARKIIYRAHKCMHKIQRSVTNINILQLAVISTRYKPKINIIIISTYLF